MARWLESVDSCRTVPIADVHARRLGGGTRLHLQPNGRSQRDHPVPSTSNVGFAGEAVVASEFSIRGYIVSLPTVDRGTDLFIENHDSGKVWRIQVKTSQASSNNTNYYQFTAKESAIQSPSACATHFAFVVRVAQEFKIFIIAQQVLEDLVNNHHMGSKSGFGKSATRTFTFIRDPKTGVIKCSKTTMTPYSAITAWNPWPVI